MAPNPNMDRFIPNRSAMDMDYAVGIVTGGFRPRNRTDVLPPWKVAYLERLADAHDLNQRILVFGDKPRPSLGPVPRYQLSPTSCSSEFCKPFRRIPERFDRLLDAPGMMDNFGLNLMDWGTNNLLAVALGSTVYLWNGSDCSTSELVTLDDDDGGPVTSVAWSPDGQHIAIGLKNSHVQLWDPISGEKIRTLVDGHRLRVGSLAWNNHILTSGGQDGRIINSDMRAKNHIVNLYKGHRKEVCGLKWSDSGQYLASGGRDKLIHIWDRMANSSNSSGRWLHRMKDHTAAVRALAWCPFQSDLLVSGGGTQDKCIKFWNIQSGATMKTINTGSGICALSWSRHERELLSSHGSSHGSSDNQLTLWRYPAMWKVAELNCHTSRVLYMAQSPNGCTVASAAGDERLMFWNVFGSPEEVAKVSQRTNHEPFSSFNRIR